MSELRTFSVGDDVWLRVNVLSGQPIWDFDEESVDALCDWKKLRVKNVENSEIEVLLENGDSWWFPVIKESIAQKRFGWPRRDSDVPCETENDPVNRPQHYTSSSIEPIDAIEAWGLPFHLANAVKYISRAKHKGSESQDVRKAIWYLIRYLVKELKEDYPYKPWES